MLTKQKSTGVRVFGIRNIVITVIMGIVIAEVTGASWVVLGSIAVVLFVVCWLLERRSIGSKTRGGFN
ncbi:MAG: hypothetical protein OXE73_17460 [Gammaproteobacteria bacterium]|nr:hypothetical protein [Gammaproteobacteria bacterium]